MSNSGLRRDHTGPRPPRLVNQSNGSPAAIDLLTTRWCNWQHTRFWSSYSRFESWSGSVFFEPEWAVGAWRGVCNPRNDKELEFTSDPKQTRVEPEMPNSDMRVFSGSANPDLTRRICEYVGISVGRANVERFPDGELLVRVEDDVRGRDCFVVQPTCPAVNDNLVELLVFIDCLHRASARRITAVLPYFGYARQDRKSQGRTPITAKLVANLIATARADRVLAVDLHAQQVQGFFDIPVDHLTAEPVLAAYFQTLDLPDKVLVSPDVGNMKTATIFAEDLGGELAVIDKRRKSGSEAIASRIIGDVEGKDVLMFDDMITTAGTVVAAAELVKEKGARSVRIGATHGIFAGPAVERFMKAPVDEIVVTDTVPLNEAARRLPNLKILSVNELLGEAITRIHQHRSVSEIFGTYRKRG